MQLNIFTVYTLWRNPGIVPLLHTDTTVITKLQGGADLMIPGLAGGPPFPEKAKKGAVVAVASAQSPTVPLMVGVCEADISALGKVQGMKGHAVQNIHWSGDELWSWSATGNSGRQAPSELAGWFEVEDEVEELETRTEGLNLEGEEDGGVSLATTAAVGANIANKEAALEGEESTEGKLSTKEIDDIFRNAFLYGIHYHKATNSRQPNFGLEFPLNMSAVMASLVQPFLPIHTPKDATQLHIKKTSWKNMKKFIKSLDKEQIIKSKDQGKTEVLILDIDFDDPAVRNFVPYRLPKKETAPAADVEKAPDSETSDGSVGQTLKYVSLHKAKEKLAPLFEPSKSDSRGYYTSSNIRDIVTSYIEHEQLVNPKNKRIITLNPLLANAVFDGKGASDKEIVAKGTVPRDILIDRVIGGCSPYHIMQRSSSSPEPPKPKAGAPPKVTILLETRSGNKTVTKVSGLEAYYINPIPLAEELRKACAGSTSVERLQGSSPKNPVMEVMVQGPQKDAVIKALEKRGVEKRWVDVVDKTKKKK
jgi:translation initiation factor 2D